MTNEELAREVARGLVETGVEGGYDAVSCSTAGDYPSIGCSQWEGARADTLLGYVDGGDYYAGRSYSDIEESGELDDLKALISSEQGIEAQLMILAQDAIDYVEAAIDAGLDDSRSIIYCGIWGPTSTHCVYTFIKKSLDKCIDMNDLDACAAAFRDDYWIWADVGRKYRAGYQNRSDNTYLYVAGLDLSAYGVPEYESGESEDE